MTSQTVKIEDLLKIPKFDDQKQVVWDASSMGDMQACPRKYQMRYLDGYRKDILDPAKAWGRAVHRGLEMFDIKQLEGMKHDESVQEAVKTLGLEYQTELHGSQDTARTLETAIRAVVWYCDYYRGDSLQTVLLEDGEPGVEVRFEVPIPGTDRRLSGIIDRLAFNQDGELLVIDRKTTKMALSPWFFKLYYPSVQMMAYVWAMTHALKTPVHGIMVEAIQAGVGFNRFERSTFFPTKEQLDEFQVNLIYSIGLADQMVEDQFWPQNFGACSDYGGCPFYDVCSRSPRVRHVWLTEDFTKHQRKN